jgi:hypothetical protein
MVKAFALAAVHVASEPGKVADDGKVLKVAKISEHKPGAVFDLDEDSFEELEAEGAVRKATRSEIAEAPAETVRRTRSTSQTAAGSTDPLDSMTKEQLLAEAERRGVDVKPGQSKDEILAALKAAA